MELLERRLADCLPPEAQAPQPLHRAMRYAVLGGGKRIRPQLVLAVVQSAAAHPLTEAQAEVAMRAACATELIHAASLVHDDLPCFDDAALRRGRPTTHHVFGEANATLAGDALIALAFEILADPDAPEPARRLELLSLLARCIGSREGIIGGQGLEDFQADFPGTVERYHALKTGALFRFAARAGAIAAGAENPGAWAGFGVRLGLAFQLADDLVDLQSSADVTGKPVGQDALHGRPNAARSVDGTTAQRRLAELLDDAITRAVRIAERPKPVLQLIVRLSHAFTPRFGNVAIGSHPSINPSIHQPNQVRNE